MNRTIVLSALGAAFAASLVLGLATAGCDDSSSTVKETPPTTSSTSSGGSSSGASSSGASSSGTPDCFTDPKTHFEIINACTDAQKVTKNPTLTKLLSDGGLPPLP